MEKGNRLLHKLDRHLGIPIVFIIGLFKQKHRKIPDNITKIAILSLGSIGDNVLMSAAIQNIRHEYPKAVISVFTGSSKLPNCAYDS